jgi:hypothetical protein
MPIHDWTRVSAGTFHHFHQRWIGAISDVLNTGGLPPDYFALAEQVTGGPTPDVITLRTRPRNGALPGSAAGVAVAVAPPRTRFVRKVETDVYAAKANRLTIRDPRGRVVAVIEIVSPGNKDSRSALRAFVEKSADFIRQGIHLLVVDLFPPTKRDPQGIHKAIWDEVHDEPFDPSPDKPLTLAAYSAGVPITAYVEPVAVGDVLPDMALFLEPDIYVPTPLESTYHAAWAVFPAPLKGALELET